jgi:hypothetical protein
MEHDTDCQMSSIILFTAFNQEIIRHEKCLACYALVEPEIRNKCITVLVYVQCLLLI